MSLLNYYSRPLVSFDAENAEHRKYAYDFIVNGKWGACPVRFILPDTPNLNLIVGIRQRLLGFYMDAEFSKQKTTSRKRNKCV